MRVGQKKWDWKFLSQIVTVQLVLSFAFQGHVSWCIENSFRKAYSNIDVSMSLLCPEVFLLSLSLDDDKHFIFSLQDFLWNVEYDFATLDVNKTCLKCIFYSSLLVLRRQKYGATVSVSLHILRLGHRWSEYWRNQSVKCSVGEHLGFLWSETNVIYGFTFFYSFSCIRAGFCKRWWYCDGRGETGL